MESEISRSANKENGDRQEEGAICGPEILPCSLVGVFVSAKLLSTVRLAGDRKLTKGMARQY